MSLRDVIRAWKDAEFRGDLSEAERAALPANPAGQIDLTDGDLDEAVGGRFVASPPVICVKSKPLSTCDCFQWG